jgi:hypothetical protein
LGSILVLLHHELQAAQVRGPAALQNQFNSLLCHAKPLELLLYVAAKIAAVT